MAWDTGIGKPNYERLRVAIGDSSDEIAASLKAAFEERGVADVTICSGAEKLCHTLDEGIVDLLIYDFHLLGDRFVNVMQRIRRREIGLNPFITIVATVRDTEAETVRRAVRAGVDDVLRIPVTADRLFESIAKSLRRHRPFMISYDYVGPVRATTIGAAKSARDQSVRVPNTMRSRTIDRLEENELRHVVALASDIMVGRRLESCGAEIDRLARRVADGQASTTAIAQVRTYGDLNRMTVVANDLREHATGTPSERVSDLAAMVLAMAQRILEAPNGKAPVEVQLLSQLAAAIRRALSTGSEAVPVIREITDTVGNFARRAVANHQLSVA